jgi:hypothetical protein
MSSEIESLRNGGLATAIKVPHDGIGSLRLYDDAMRAECHICEKTLAEMREAV